MSVLPHQRANHERMNDTLVYIRGLWSAFQIIDWERPDFTSGDDVCAARRVLLDLLDERIRDLDRLHSIEWVGLGGCCDRLTPDEVATARGQ